MRGRGLACGKTFESRAVHEKNIEPSVVVVVVEGDAAAGGFEKIFVFVFAAEDGLGVEAGFAGDVDEADAEIVADFAAAEPLGGLQLFPRPKAGARAK